MYKIINKRQLATNIILMDIEAPLIAREAKPGQFVILRVHDKGERIPLTITDILSPEIISIIFQVVGKTTILLSKKQPGDYILDLLGPLGRPALIRNYGNIIVAGGGVGIAVAYPEAKALKNAGNYVYSVIGAKTKDLIILEDEMRKISDELIVMTDDGSYGKKGVVTEGVKEILMRTKIDLVIAIGPVLMMQSVSLLTKEWGINTIVNLNPIMVDGTGMCGACRVSIDGKTKFACVDGPEFDGHKVDYDLLLARNSQYIEKEKEILRTL